MDSSTTFKQTDGMNSKGIAPEFGTWPVEGTSLENIQTVRHGFDTLLSTISQFVPTQNARYLALVKTKLEEACLFAVKAIAKP